VNVYRKHLAESRHCLVCKYPLRALQPATRNCPECGENFNTDDVIIGAIPKRERSSLWKNPLFDGLIIVVGLLLLPFLPPFLITFVFLVVLVLLMTGILHGIAFIVRLVRGARQADGCLMLTNEMAAFVRNGEREFFIRWPTATRYLVKAVGRGHWRVRLSSRAASVDVIIAGDKRTIAALRVELKARTGHRGTVGWGTLMRNQR